MNTPNLPIRITLLIFLGATIYCGTAYAIRGSAVSNETLSGRLSSGQPGTSRASDEDFLRAYQEELEGDFEASFKPDPVDNAYSSFMKSTSSAECRKLVFEIDFGDFFAQVDFHT